MGARNSQECFELANGLSKSKAKTRHRSFTCQMEQQGWQGVNAVLVKQAVHRAAAGAGPQGRIETMHAI